MTRTAVEAPSQPRPKRRPRWSPLPLLLAFLALWDLREDLVLLADHFTLTSLFYLVRSHPLAVAVLLLQPSLWKQYS